MIRPFTLVALAAAVFAAAAGGGTPTPPVDPVAALGKFGPCPPALVTPSRDDRGFDCRDVVLDLSLDFDRRRIAGRARHEVVATRALAALALDLTDSLEVQQVWRSVWPASFTHGGDVIEIALDPPLAEGEQATITIQYAGHPPREGLLGFSFESRDGVPAAYTLSEPEGASSWWPCKDVPDDKLLATIILDIPDSLYAGSNGRLVSDRSAGGRRKMTWREEWPIAPYLVSVAATNYSVFDDEFISSGREKLPILYLAYPEDRAAAESSWKRTPLMIGAFEDRFGAYPFPGEKYGMAEFSWGGAMEHQTLTSYGEYAVDGWDTNDWLVAHELAHQWWGNRVTLASWEHIWLNEGFARFSEALWYESQGGIKAYREWIRGLWRPTFPGAIVPPDYLFNSTVYQKGAWVLHMLRGLLGDPIFFTALRVYGDRHAYSNARTEDLIAVFEETTGEDLGWFFDQWVYGTGRPFYDATWQVVDNGRLMLDLWIEQNQAEPPFRMPIDIEIQDVLGRYRHRVLDSLRTQEFLLPLRGEPIGLTLDPDDWILKDVIHGSDVDGSAALGSGMGLPAPSPGSPPFRIVLHGPGVPRHAEILDAQGRRVRALEGTRVLTWDGRDARGREMPSGLYIVRLAQPGCTQAEKLWLLR